METKKRKIDKYFYRTFFGLLSVVAFQNLIVFSVNLADSIMIGSYNETAMSGVSLANQIQFLLQMLISGAASGLSAIASQYWGKRETEPIKRVFAASLWAAFVMAFVLEAAVLITPRGVLSLLSNDAGIVAAGAEYIRIMAHSYLIFAASNMLIALMRSVETVKIGFYTALMALVINISLNYVLIFGKFGAPELGARGAAWATLISRVVELCAVLAYVLLMDKKIKMKVRDFFRIERAYLRDYIKAGAPLIGSGGSWGIAMTLQTAIIGRLGAVAVGANAIAAPVSQVAGVFYGASGTASGVLIGKTVGEGNVERVKKYARKLQLLYPVIGLVCSALHLILRGAVIGLYDVSADTRAMATVFINILAVTIIGSSYEAPALTGIVSGGGDTKFVLINDLIFMWGLVLPASALSAFVFRWPVPVTFFILKADQLLKCFVALVKVNRFRWIRDLTVHR